MIALIPRVLDFIWKSTLPGNFFKLNFDNGILDKSDRDGASFVIKNAGSMATATDVKLLETIDRITEPHCMKRHDIRGQHFESFSYHIFKERYHPP